MNKFLDTFFNAKVMAKYLPDIVAGTWLTIELAFAIVVSGILAGLLLALIRSVGVRPLNWLIIFVVDLFRSLPPLVIIVLIYFGLARSRPVAGLAAIGVLAIFLVWTAPSRWGLGIALHYLSRRLWPDPDDPLPRP